MLYSNPIQIAYFVLAEQILRAANGIGSVFQEVYMSIKKKVEKKMLNKNLIVLIFITLLASFIGFLTIDIIFDKLFKDKFIDAIPVIKLIIICWFFITIIKITNYPMSESLKEISNINLLAIVILILSIVLMKLNYLFFNINALSVSIFFLISVIIHFIMNCIMMKKQLDQAIKVVR